MCKIHVLVILYQYIISKRNFTFYYTKNRYTYSYLLINNNYDLIHFLITYFIKLMIIHSNSSDTHHFTHYVLHFHDFKSPTHSLFKGLYIGNLNKFLEN